MTTTSSGPAEEPDAIAAFASIADLVGERDVAVFLDFDGTLTPLVAHPADSRLDARGQAILERLGRVAFVALVTGRALADLEARLADSGFDAGQLVMAGSHGYEMRGLAPPPVADEATRARLGAVLPAVEAGVAGIRGVMIEAKGFAIAVHWRHVAEADVARVRKVVEAVAATDDALKLTDGKMVFEIRPALTWHKGKAVAWITETLGLGDRVPVFVGDDVTDIDGLAAVRDRGIGIAVGDTIEPGQAGWRLADHAAALTFLDRLATFLAQRRSG